MINETRTIYLKMYGSSIDRLWCQNSYLKIFSANDILPDFVLFLYYFLIINMLRKCKIKDLKYLETEMNLPHRICYDGI